jgi:hypothetical protein
MEVCRTAVCDLQVTAYDNSFHCCPCGAGEVERWREMLECWCGSGGVAVGLGAVVSSLCWPGGGVIGGDGQGLCVIYNHVVS